VLAGGGRVSEHLTALVVERRATELSRAAEHSRRVRDARAARARRRAVRASAARLLVAAAARLDGGLLPPVPAGDRP
jgi:hypothetical protein